MVHILRLKNRNWSTHHTSVFALIPGKLQDDFQSQWLFVSVTNMFLSFPFLWIWFSILKLKNHNRHVRAYHFLEWGRKLADNCSIPVVIPVSIYTSFWNLNFFWKHGFYHVVFYFFIHIKFHWMPKYFQNSRH